MTSCTGPRIRQLGNPLQNRSEQQISLISPVVPPRIFIKIGLQILLRHGVIDSTNSAFYQTPESFNRVRVNVAHYVNLGAVADSLMFLYAPSDTIIDRVLIDENCALWQYVFMYDPKDALCCHIGRSQSLYPADAAFAAAFHDSDYWGFLFVTAHWTARMA